MKVIAYSRFDSVHKIVLISAILKRESINFNLIGKTKYFENHL